MTNESLAQSYLKKAGDRVEEYTREDARTAQQDAERVLHTARRVIRPTG